MKDAASTWALVVGIDAYDHVKPLTGAARDAVDVIHWLRRLKVPDEQILLHAAPCASTERDIEALRLPVAGCSEPQLWESFVKLTNQRGAKLFVFLMGHGLFEPGGARVFLTQEANQKANPPVMKNLGIDWYAGYLRGLDFDAQYLVMDGCLNYPYTETERSKFKAGEQSAVVPQPPRSAVMQIFAFGASQGEKAMEVDGHGLFTRTLLAALDPEAPAPECVDIDESTGAFRLDLARAMNDIVGPAVTEAAPRQNPGFQSMGTGQVPGVLPIVELEPTGTARVSVRVDPEVAVSGVRRISLWSDTNVWRRVLPKPPASQVPPRFESILPIGLDVVARCVVSDGGGWVMPPQHEFVADHDRDIVFALRTGDPEPPSPASSQARIECIGSDGEVLEAMTESTYAELARALDEEPIAVAFDANPVTIPDFVVRSEPSGAVLEAISGSEGLLEQLTRRVASRLDRALPPDVTTRIRTMPGANTSLVRVPITPAEAVRLGGLIQAQPILTIANSAVTLADLVRDPVVPVDPGTYTVRLNLPWGSWATRITVPENGEAEVTLPRAVGMPPLRVRLLRPRKIAGEIDDAGPNRSVVTLTKRTRPRSAGMIWERARPQVFPWHGTLWTAPSAFAAPRWRAHLEIPQGRRTLGCVASELGPIAIQLGNAPRAEPLSLLPNSEWDAIVAAGRLNAVSPEQAVGITSAKWFDPLIGLAGAYACFARGAEEDLQVVLDNLARLHPDLPDLAVLQAGLDRALDRNMADTRHLLETLVASKAVPVFRWGVAIGLLGAGYYEVEPLAHALSDLESRLVPSSIWTLWEMEGRILVISRTPTLVSHVSIATGIHRA